MKKVLSFRPRQGVGNGERRISAKSNLLAYSCDEIITPDLQEWLFDSLSLM